jgi:hypothetical protein
VSPVRLLKSSTHSPSLCSSSSSYSSAKEAQRGERGGTKKPSPSTALRI